MNSTRFIKHLVADASLCNKCHAAVLKISHTVLIHSQTIEQLGPSWCTVMLVHQPFGSLLVMNRDDSHAKDIQYGRECQGRKRNHQSLRIVGSKVLTHAHAPSGSHPE